MVNPDVVIVGAGIVGSSIACHLTAAGGRNVLVIERETRQGLGSTGKSMGGVRAPVRDRSKHPHVSVLNPVLRSL